MLPDFVAAKNSIKIFINEYLHSKIMTSNNFLKDITHKEQHEGHRISMKTFDGYNDESEYETMSSEFKINIQDIIDKGPIAFKEYIDTMAEDIIQNKSKVVLQKLNEITRNTGNVTISKGDPFTQEKYFETLENIDLEFNDDGTPNNLTIVMGPNLFNIAKERLMQWESDQTFQEKYVEIIKKKKKIYNDRENNRKLVD